MKFSRYIIDLALNCFRSVETERFELLTPCLQGRCSPNWATPPWIWQPPAFPCRLQHSIIGRFSLNHRVRDVDGCFPKAHRHQNYVVINLFFETTPLSIPLRFISIGVASPHLRSQFKLLLSKLVAFSLFTRCFSLITKQWKIFTRFP